MLQKVIESIQNQKKGKRSGPNGLHMKSFIYCGLKLYIHLSLLFTSFVRHCYLLRRKMENAIKPMVKNKGGDLTDVNNYRAIALSNVETKIFEAIILCKVRVDSEYDAPQFGFNPRTTEGGWLPPPCVFQTPYFFRVIFSETLPYTSGLLTSTSFGE